jgi:hypothetical protein
MNRAFWFAAGAGATVYAMNRVRRARDAVTVDGLRDRANGLTLGARLFREEFEQGRVEKETELRERFGLMPHGRPELEAPHTRQIMVSTSSTTNGVTSSTTNGTEKDS